MSPHDYPGSMSPDIGLHRWFECRPAHVMVPGASAEDASKTSVALRAVWDSLPDSDRHRFHKFTCENDTSAATLAVVIRVIDTLRSA